jgi:hypothetical protein
MQFAGVDLIAVNDGAADQIKIGVRGIVSALYLTDLRNKTRRGLEGKLRSGMRAGGLPFGYRPITGRPGEHEIYEPEAEIVRRIFQEYAAGFTPRRIAYSLNQDSVAPVRGGAWNASTINGSVKRGTGILANEIYNGEIVWNKVGKIKNPATGKRVPRINPRSEWRHVDAPHLRIVDKNLFEAVQAERERRTNGPHVQRRGPQRLFSGLLKCSCCGSSIVACGTGRGGKRRGMCTRARESGSCQNKRFVYLDVIEEAVISGLIDQLMHPDIIAEAVREYHAEMRRLQGERARSRNADERKLAELQRSVERLIDLVASGTVPGSAVARRIAEAEAEANDLQNRLVATAPPEVISLHPKALDYYLKAVTMLSETLSARQDDEAMKLIRELVDSIVIYPRDAREPCGSK